MQFEWDEHKHRANVFKHGIDFATAAFVFADPHLALASFGAGRGSAECCARLATAQATEFSGGHGWFYGYRAQQGARQPVGQLAVYRGIRCVRSVVTSQKRQGRRPSRLSEMRCSGTPDDAKGPPPRRVPLVHKLAAGPAKLSRPGRLCGAVGE